MVDLTGKRFGRLVVFRQIGKNKWGNYLWLCECDCKQKTIVASSNLKHGHTKSCGCLQKEIISQHNTKHGHQKNGEMTRIYSVWAAMIQRCTNPKNKQYKDYGKRGISVCKRWRKFSDFLIDMGNKWKSGLTIERTDNGRGYYKENCQWVTQKKNSRNKRNNRLITYGGKTQCLSQWAEETGINVGTIHWRLNNGWLIKKIITTPTKKE